MAYLSQDGKIFVDCGACCGDGHVLHPRLSEVYAAIRSVGQKGIRTFDLAKRLRISPENAANLTKRLYQHDLVEREGISRRAGYRWRVKGTP